MTDLEKRHTRRYELADPVDYWWLAPSGSVQASHGMTLDISTNSVMVIARRCPPKGVRIQMTIQVARHDGSDCPLELHGEGIVVRIEPGKSTQPGQRSSGFVALVHFYSEISNDTDDRIRILLSRGNTFSASRVDESGDCVELFRRSRGSEL
jgi:hypothetical protein